MVVADQVRLVLRGLKASGSAAARSRPTDGFSAMTRVFDTAIRVATPCKRTWPLGRFGLGSSFHPRYHRPTLTEDSADGKVQRFARNQVLFRAVNERIKDVGDGFGLDDGAEFVCECSNVDCTARVVLTGVEYEGLRADPRQFFIAVGHFQPLVARVVSEGERYWVVETLPGEPTAIAERTAEPRDGD